MRRDRRAPRSRRPARASARRRAPRRCRQRRAVNAAATASPSANVRRRAPSSRGASGVDRQRKRAAQLRNDRGGQRRGERPPGLHAIERAVRRPGRLTCDERLDHVGLRRVRQHARRPPASSRRSATSVCTNATCTGVPASAPLELAELPLAREHPERILDRRGEAAPRVAAAADRLDAGESNRPSSCRLLARPSVPETVRDVQQVPHAEVVLVEFGRGRSPAAAPARVARRRGRPAGTAPARAPRRRPTAARRSSRAWWCPAAPPAGSRSARAHRARRGSRSTPPVPAGSGTTSVQASSSMPVTGPCGGIVADEHSARHRRIAEWRRKRLPDPLARRGRVDPGSVRCGRRLRGPTSNGAQRRRGRRAAAHRRGAAAGARTRAESWSQRASTPARGPRTAAWSPTPASMSGGSAASVPSTTAGRAEQHARRLHRIGERRSRRDARGGGLRAPCRRRAR